MPDNFNICDTPVAGGGSLNDPTIARGDIPVKSGGYIASPTNLAPTATATANTFNNGFVPSNAINGNYAEASCWYSGSGNKAADWLKLDFGANVNIQSFRLVQTTASPGERCTSYDVQSSPDGTTWTTRHSVTSAGPDSGTVMLSSGIITARYWRFLGVAPATGPGWTVLEVELHGGTYIETSLDRLAIGTDGQVLTVDSTQPSGMKWAAPV